MLKTTIAALALLAAATPAHADELQNRVLAGARANRGEGYAFRQTIVLERTGAARKVVVQHYDPRRAPAERWSLVSVDGRAPTAKELADARKTKREPELYASIVKWFGAPATRSDPAAGTAVYRFARLPAGVVKIGSHDASADTQAEAWVNTRGPTPFVERVRLTTTKGFRIMLVASLKSMTVTSRYRPLADGTIAPLDTASDMAGSLMGKSGALKTAVTYADHRPAR